MYNVQCAFSVVACTVLNVPLYIDKPPTIIVQGGQNMISPVKLLVKPGLVFQAYSISCFQAISSFYKMLGQIIH